MGIAEVRTQIYLPREQHRALKRAAKLQSVSMAQLIRDAVEEYLDRGAAAARGPDREDPAFMLLEKAKEIGGSGLPDADARDHDDELYGPVHS